MEKAEVIRVQLQQARQFDDVGSADQVTDPELKGCIENQPGNKDFPADGSVTLYQRRVYDLRRAGMVVETNREIIKILQQRGKRPARAMYGITRIPIRPD